MREKREDDKNLPSILKYLWIANVTWPVEQHLVSKLSDYMYTSLYLSMLSLVNSHVYIPLSIYAITR